MKAITLVERLLKQSQANRDNDKLLLLSYWELQGFYLSETQRKVFIDKCTSPETITRARRALKHLYPSSEKVDNARFGKYLDYKYKYDFISNIDSYID